MIQKLIQYFRLSWAMVAGIECFIILFTVESSILILNYITNLFGFNLEKAGFIKSYRGYYNRWASCMFPYLLGIEIKPIFEEEVDKTEPTIFMYTHASFLDILICSGHATVMVNLIGKKTLFDLPIFGFCIRRIGHISIDRTKLKSAIGSLATAAEEVKTQRINIAIAPEGTRRRKKSIGSGSVAQLLPFKKGPFHLAKNAESSITPVCMTGCNRISSKGFRNGTIYCQFLKRIPASLVKSSTVEEMRDIVRKKMSKKYANTNIPEDKILGYGRKYYPTLFTYVAIHVLPLLWWILK